MARLKPSESGKGRSIPARSPDERENQVSSKAYDLAERQIDEGTVSSQVLTHFLKMGSTREQLERQRIEHENELSRVKREAMEREDRMEDLFAGAIRAMRTYQGADPEEGVDEFAA